MFTGLVQRLGTLSRLARSGGGASLFIRVDKPWPDPLVLGESIAVQGVCLTVAQILPDGFSADVLDETLDCTAFGSLSPNSKVNLERALAAGDRLGGHIVQGHVDAIGHVLSIRPRGRDIVFRVGTDSSVLCHIVHKGSIAIDGTSLTVSALSDEKSWFEVNLIPTTLRETSLSDRKSGDAVNLETDVLGKYVERLLRGSVPRSSGERTDRQTDRQTDGTSEGLSLAEMIALD